MSRLSDLDGKGVNPNVVLLQTPSVKLTMFLEDKIKRHYECRNDVVIDVRVKKDLKKVRDVIGVIPPLARRWYVRIDLDKFDDKELATVIAESSTVVFFCTCSKYAIFKNFKDSIKDVYGVYDFYIMYLRRNDFIYLYDAFVPKEKRLTKQLFDYTVQSYSGDIEVLFDLFIALNDGKEFKTRKDISDLCGVGGLSVESFIFTMLKPISGSVKGLTKVLKNRIKASSELAEMLGYTSFYNFMAKSLMTLINLKMLMISGDVYKSVHNLPECYNENELARYQKYIWRLNTLPLSTLLLLRQCMGSKAWRTDLDILNFIYLYYETLGYRHILALNMENMFNNIEVAN